VAGIIRFVDATTECVNALTVLASPRLLFRRRLEAERKRTTFDLRPVLRGFAELAAEMKSARPEDPLQVLAGRALEIAEQISRAPDARDNIDRAVVDAARRALAEFGIPEPPGGWESAGGPR
jgi:hypothetical protein